MLRWLFGAGIITKVLRFMVRSFKDRFKPISLSDIVSRIEGEPIDGNDLGFIGYDLVGHGKVANGLCGVFTGYYCGCDRAELHDYVDLDGVSHKGMVHVDHAIFHSCNRPRCPECMKYGWRVRLAKSIEAHLREASKHHGQIEHLMISVPRSEMHLSMEVVKKKIIRALKKRGVIGGNIIPHVVVILVLRKLGVRVLHEGLHAFLVGQ